VTRGDPAWRDALAVALDRAPDELRALASDELHIGGFTNVRLAHPVLDLREIADEARAARALLFFAAAALLRGATLARVHVRREHATALPHHAKRELRGVAQRIDDDNAGLLRYFDLYLLPLAEVRDAAGTRLVASVARSFDAPASTTS
jgi:hypothetical protein